jgi:serine protease Do
VRLRLLLIPILALSLVGSACGRETRERLDDVDARLERIEQQLDITDTTVTGDTLAPQPIAEIAAAALPAVVQIDTSFGLGAGVIYSADGYIITAAHVVGAETPVTIRLFDGRTVEGEVLGTHQTTDIAVVAIDPVPGMPVADLALRADLEVGQVAVALGSPFGLDQTVTAGIVSAVDRVVDGVTMVQTDAAINPGNSGGPLVDAAGRVIGINDMIFSESGANAGVGFAISIDLAVLVAEQIVAGDEVQLAFLGVGVSDVRGERPGALVEEVVPDSGADGAGIEVGDVIVAVDDTTIRNSGDLRVAIIRNAPDDTVTITVIRDGDELELEATLGGIE